MAKQSLRDIRTKRLHMTLAEMVKKINADGCDVPFLSRFERGLHGSEGITPTLAQKIGEAYGVELKLSARRIEL